MNIYTYNEIGDLADRLRQLSSRVYVVTTLEEKDKLSSDIGRVARILDDILNRERDSVTIEES